MPQVTTARPSRLGFKYLERYVGDEGHAQVPVGYVNSDAFPLGRWVNRQRTGKLKLTSQRIAQLQSVHGWVWDAREWQWELGFKHLNDYLEQNHDCLVPAKYLSSNGYTLGRWVNKQRSHCDKLTPDRRSRLEALPGWVWSAK